MNNIPYPFIQPTYYQENIYDEIKKIKEEIILLKEQIKKLENINKKDYLKKDDTLYMI